MVGSPGESGHAAVTAQVWVNRKLERAIQVFSLSHPFSNEVVFTEEGSWLSSRTGKL